MTAPGYPVGRRRNRFGPDRFDFRDLLMPPEYQPYVRTGPDPVLPEIPYRERGRVMTLNEMANASVGERPKPTFRDFLRFSIADVGQSGLFDPNAENPVEAFLGAATGTFAQGERRRGAVAEQEQQGALLDEAIIRQHHEEQRAEQDRGLAQAMQALRAQLLGAQITGAKLGNIKAAGVLDRQAGGADVEGIAAEWERQGRKDVAAFIRANPDAVRDAPGSFLRPPEPDETVDQRIKEAVKRADAADRAAGEQLARRLADPWAEPLQPGEQEQTLAAVRRMLDPSYDDDAIIRSHYRGTGGGGPPNGTLGGENQMTGGTAQETAQALQEAQAAHRARKGQNASQAGAGAAPAPSGKPGAPVTMTEDDYKAAASVVGELPQIEAADELKKAGYTAEQIGRIMFLAFGGGER